MKRSRFLKAEIAVLVCVAALWAVDLKTRCVPRATAGALRQVTRVAPNSQCAHELLGSTYLYLGRTDEGDKAYGRAEVLACKKAVESNPPNPNAHYALGDACERLGDFESSIQTYEEFLRSDPTDRDGYERLAGCYWELGRPEKSVETWKRAKACDPEWRWPYFALAFDYNDLGRYDEAIAEWKQLIELEPDVAGLNALLADVYLNTGQYTEAVSACTRALELQPDNKKAHYNLGRAHFKLGKMDLAWKEYEALKGLDAELSNDLLRLLGERKAVPEQALQGQHEAQAQMQAYPAEQDELLAIDAYVVEERQKIELWYVEQLAELKVQFDKRLETLDQKDKSLSQ